jgi:hypothetical protein
MQYLQLAGVLVAAWIVNTAQASEPRKVRVDVQEREGYAFRVGVLMQHDHSAFSDAFARIKLAAPSDGASMEKLRLAWAEVTRSKGTERVTVRMEDSLASVEEEKGMALVTFADLDDSRVTVSVRMPSPAFSMLMAAGGERFDYDSALRVLYDRGNGETLAIETDGTRVDLQLE